MNLKNAFLRASLSGELLPPAINGRPRSGIRLGADLVTPVPETASILQCSLIFNAADQNAEFNFISGEILLSGTGTRQVEVLFFNEIEAITAPGTLPVTVTGAGITGSPLVIPVAVNPQTHKNGPAIAAAIVKALAAVPAITDLYEVSALPPLANPATNLAASSPNIFLTARSGRANDGTLSVSIPGVILGLNFNNNATRPSANYIAGAAGVVLERTGGNGNDLFGRPVPGLRGATGLLVRHISGASSVSTSASGYIAPGAYFLHGGMGQHSDEAFVVSAEAATTTEPVTVEVIACLA